MTSRKVLHKLNFGKDLSTFKSDEKKINNGKITIKLKENKEKF